MSLVDFSLAGRRAVVTGAGKGIGRAICLAMAEAGADIAAFSRAERDLVSLEPEIAALGRRFTAVAGDVTDGSAIRHLVDRVEEEFGGADIVVNNAGVVYPEPALATSAAHWHDTLAVNLTGPFQCAQAFAPAMLARGWGRIINISSDSGVVGAPDHAAYCASKGGLNALTKVLAIEWGPGGVTVNAIAPTIVMTPMGEQVWGDPAKSDPVRAQIPTRRFGRPREIAAAVVYLASAAGAMINGHILLLDGGFTAQ
jgi:NAD(P)-dependent dehydrogenase (short-subunit alcohol dehydrogenase family)